MGSEGVDWVPIGTILGSFYVDLGSSWVDLGWILDVKITPDSTYFFEWFFHRFVNGLGSILGGFFDGFLVIVCYFLRHGGNSKNSTASA